MLLIVFRGIHVGCHTPLTKPEAEKKKEKKKEKKERKEKKKERKKKRGEILNFLRSYSELHRISIHKFSKGTFNLH